MNDIKYDRYLGKQSKLKWPRSSEFNCKDTSWVTSPPCPYLRSFIVGAIPLETPLYQASDVPNFLMSWDLPP